MATDQTSDQKAHVTLRLPAELLRFVDRQATGRFMTRNAYLQDLIVQQYQSQPQQDGAGHVGR